MPNLPPKEFVPGDYSFHNGMPTRSTHAVEIDRYTAWLVAVARTPKPAILGSAMVDGVTYEARTDMPHYTEHLAFGLWLTGAGTVNLTCDDDTYDCEMEVEVSQGHDVSTDAQWVWIQTGLDSVSANGSTRALDVDDQSSPHEVTVTITLTDDSGSQALQCHGLILWPLPRSQGSSMPA